MMMKRDLTIAFFIGLLAQLLWVLLLPQPSYMDAYYYTTNGRQLATGAGFTEEVIWQYLDEPESLPTPSHSYWMPLTSLLAGLGYLLGESFRWAQLPFWLLSGVLPALSYLICHYLHGVGWQRWTAVCLTASFGFYARLIGQPSTFAPFGVTGAVCLLAVGFALSQKDNRWWLLAGLMAGLAHLTRADGLLLLLVAGWVWLLSVWQQKSWLHWQPLGALLVGYLLTFGWWLVRGMMVFERPLSIAGTQTIFLTNYDDLFAYQRSFNLDSYLAWGWGNILQSKLDAVGLALQTFVAINGVVFLVPFILLAWWRLRREPLLRPFNWYFLALYLAMTLVFTFPGARGGLLHSSIVVWPFMMALAALGLGWAVDGVATKLTHWQPAKSKPIFATLFVLITFVISFVVGLGRLEGLEEGEIYRQIAEEIPETAVVMTANAPAFYYHTQRPSLSLPNEPPARLLEAVQAFGVTHLVLDLNHPRPLAPLYNQPLAHEQFVFMQAYPILGLDGEQEDQIQLYYVIKAND